MADIAASVLARLKNKAAENGKSFQLCVQLFCQEEFLRRLEKSKHVENLVLKGGLFIYSLTGFDSRVTVDVDFLLRNTSNSLERLKAILEDIIAVPTGNEFVTFEIKKVEPISVAKKYAGVATSLIARIKNVRIQFGIDFGVGDVVTPARQKLTIPTQLPDFDAPTINAYSIESVVAEKVDAILSLMEFSSRMKDYYDVYYLANKFDFCGKTLSEAFRRTFANRERRFTIEQLEQVARFSSVDEMRKKWNAFIRKINVGDLDYGTALKAIVVFLYNPLKAAVEDEVFTDQWVAAEKQWKK
ncbi:MAG: nucleotidyl transferase AbiEii/AbiGii toxin family protein [Thermoguttaceae bacterium]|nr:nucleotidyl transferase AbiEii/AbiGii toxin family protein [Thermoguttaceae bacterium]